MPIMKLRQQDVRTFQQAPELAMGVQIGEDAERGNYLVVIGGDLALWFDDELGAQVRQTAERRWRDGRSSLATQVEDYGNWRGQLPEAPPLRPPAIEIGLAVLAALRAGPMAPQPPMPAPPAVIYGHTPFPFSSGTDEVFYRFESKPTSSRIDQNQQSVLAGTYASPASELPFMPTGFAAVGRCALPALFPARWRWEIQPTAGTSFAAGACVPLYGQAGGGVEVRFTQQVANRGPIANPVVLPEL